MAMTNQERVGKAMELLRTGLAPFVEREFKSQYQAQAVEAAGRFRPWPARRFHEQRLDRRSASRLATNASIVPTESA